MSSSAGSSVGGNAWTGSGTNTPTVLSNGITGPAALSYNYNAGGTAGATGSWTFETTADQSGPVDLNWSYSGTHSYFDVKVGLTAFVTHAAGPPSTTELVNDAAAQCCSAPSGGFTYSGRTTLNVVAGETYGFTMGGSNFDSNAILQGTLTVKPNLVANGSFERPTAVSSTFDTFDAPSSNLTDWTINRGSIDLISGYWPAYRGAQSIDLDGSHGPVVAGTISQELETVPGRTYELRFHYSANPDGCSGTPSMKVLWGGNQVSGSPFTHPTAQFADMNWLEGHATVSATGAHSTLKFESADADSSACGIAIDDVSVIESGATPPAAAPGVPQLFGAVPDVQPVASGGPYLGLAGVFTANPSEADLSLRLFSNATCSGAPGQPIGTKAGLAANPQGFAAFAVDDTFPNLSPGTFVSAQSRRGTSGSWSACSNAVVVGPNNTSWPSASTVGGDASTTGYLSNEGEARWYKVPILPNSRVEVTLSNLPKDYDLVMFSDIQAAYDALNAGASSSSGPGLAQNDLTKRAASVPTDAFNTSQYDSASWDPLNWNPDLNSSASFSASQWSASQWSASQWSASQWSASQWSASQWSASQWSASQWSASQWSASQWSASQWSGSFPSDPILFSSAQTASLLAISGQGGTAPEFAGVNTWNNTGYIYVRVQGKNGLSDPAQPFTLTTKRIGTLCQGVSAPASAPDPATPGWSSATNTVILTDRSRMTFSGSLDTKLVAFAGRSEVNGAIVNVDADPTVHALNAQADAHPTCPYAKNLVATRVKQIVDAYRKVSPIKYVVVVGGDTAIPFFRYPDPALIGSETMYSPPVLDNSASQASLRLGFVLNQDGFGSTDSLSLHGNSFPVPDLPVGRLVETPAEISGMLDAYMATSAGVVATPTSSLVTGYDFLQDAADGVSANLRAGIGTGAGTKNDSLITNQNVAPSVTTVNGTPDRTHSWTGADLRKSLLNSGRHDLVFLAGHFSANDALAADYATNVLSTELATSAANFANAIVFSAGCHAGYNIVDGDAVPNVTQPLDWVQAFARKQATLIAGTGYQYGDTDFVAYSERIYTEFSRQLRITTSPAGAAQAVSVGDALVRSKRNYLKTTAAPLSGLDEKALLEATLFGLPMLSVNLPTGRIYEAPDLTTVAALDSASGGAGGFLGLKSVEVDVPTTGLTSTSVQLKNSNNTNGPIAEYLTGPNGVVVKPTQPILPLVSRNVSAPASAPGYVLNGIGFLGGQYVDKPDIVPLTAAQATEIRGVHAPFYTDVLFPPQPYSANYFDALGGVAGNAVAGGVTRLMLTPAQHVTSPADLTKSTRRTFSDMNVRLYYSGNTQSYCYTSAPFLLAATPCVLPAVLGTPALSAPPSTSGVDSSYDQGASTLTVRAHILGDPIAGIHQAWVTWTIPPVPGTVGTWASVPLAQDAVDPTLYTGSVSGIADPAAVRFMVQAASGVGKVTLDNNNGAFYRPGSIPGGTPSSGTPAASALQIDPAPPASTTSGQPFQLSATLTAAGSPVPDKLVRLAIGSAGVFAITGNDGRATATITASLLPATYPVTAGFAGDDGFTSSSDTRLMTVTPAATSLSPFSLQLPLVSAGGETGMTTTLTETVGPSTSPMTQQPLTFSLTGPVSKTYAVITDGLGKASVPSGGLVAGTYTVTANYAGDATHLSAVRATSVGGGTAKLVVSEPCVGPAPAGAILGGPGNDTINGTPGDDVIYDLRGNNKIDGKGGSDTICTGTGNDTVVTGDGDDTIVDTGGVNAVTSGGGDDRVTAASGIDKITTGAGNDVVTDTGGANAIDTGAGDDKVTTGTGLDAITTGAGNDVVTDTGGANAIDAGAGDDKVTTGTGKDAISAGDGNDVITDAGGDNAIDVGAGIDTVTAGSGNDVIQGGSQDDTINAGNGNNTVNGGDGNDRITTGTGIDKIDGGAGFDICSPGSGTNTVKNCEG